MKAVSEKVWCFARNLLRKQSKTFLLTHFLYLITLEYYTKLYEINVIIFPIIFLEILRKLRLFFYHSSDCQNPANIYIFKVNCRNTRNDVVNLSLGSLTNLCNICYDSR